jgi:hypothetical protein
LRSIKRLHLDVTAGRDELLTLGVFNLEAKIGEANLLSMNKFARFLSALATGTAAGIAIFVTPAPQADPAELDCTADTPCTGPQLFAVQPDGPDGGAEVEPAPRADILAASGPTTPLPPLGWMNDTMTMPPRRWAWRPSIQQQDDGWLAYAATHQAAVAAQASSL